MPVSRDLAEDLSRELIALYGRAEAQLAADIAMQLAAGLDRPDWAADKLAALGKLRRAARRTLSRLRNATDEAALQAIAEAYAAGAQAGLAELVRTARGRADVLHDLPGAETVQRLALALAGRLRGTHLPVLRWTEDVYRKVVATELPDIALGLATRRRVAQRVWEGLLEKGVTGFTDRAGRAWNLATYVEMATRTGVAQAALEGHLDRLAVDGIDLVQVSDSPMECRLCRPWEGKVLTRGGLPGSRTITVEHAIDDGRMVEVRIAGSVAEAIATGLMHPQCTHRFSAHLPGVTKVPTSTEDPEGEAAREKLRALERKVRREKVLAAAAIDPRAGKAHTAKVRDLQAQIRDHVAAYQHLGLRRKPYREQVDLGHTSPPPVPPSPPPIPKPTPPPSPVSAPTSLKPAARKASGGPRTAPKKTVPKPAFQKEPLTRRQLERIDARQEIDRLEAELQEIPSSDPRYVSLRRQLDDARQRFEQRPGGFYNWESPYYDEVVGYRVVGSPGLSDLWAHTDEGLDSRIPGRLRADLHAELMRQAGLTPRSMLEFKGIDDIGNFDLNNQPNSYAYYHSTYRRMWFHPRWHTHRAEQDRSIRSDILVGWATPTERSALDSVVAHEYGHHLAYRVLREPTTRQRRLVQLLDKAFNTGGYLERQFRANPDFVEVVNGYLNVYGVGAAAHVVSRYALTNYQELLAEIWSEYTTTDNPRSHIRSIGEMILSMAEASDVVRS